MLQQKRTVHKFFILTAIISLILLGASVSPAFSASWSFSNVSNNLTRSANSSIAVDKSGTIHVVWEEQDGQIYYNKSSDGITWLLFPPTNVSRSGASPSGSPKIAVAPDGSLHVVWAEQTTTNWEVFYAQFRNSQWSTPVNVSNTTSLSVDPQIAVDSAGKIHVVWRDNNDIAYSSSSDGQTWSTLVALTTGGQVGEEPPSLSAAGNNLFVAWQAKYLAGSPPVTNYDIRYRKHDGSTASWGAPSVISGGSTVYRGTPAIAADLGGKPHVIWADQSATNTQIYYSRLEGTSWTTPYNISSTANLSGRPAIAADGVGNLHAVWEEVSIIDRHIYYSKFNGSSWSYRENIQQSIPVGANQSQAAAIAADGTANPNIVYQDSGVGNSDILFERTTGPITVFATGFENAPWMSNPASGWDVGSVPYPGQPSAVPVYWNEVLATSTWNAAHSGSWGAWCAGYGGNTSVTVPKYVPYMVAYARTTVDLTSFKDATLNFWYRVSTTDYPSDAGTLSVFLNGDFSKPKKEVWYGATIDPWTAQTPPIYLTDYVGNKVTLEWNWISDGDIAVGEGMFIDDISVTGNPKDQVAPSAVANLTAGSPTLSSLNLSWTAPGDNGSTGTAAAYDIRYSTSPINDGNWASATKAPGTIPPPQLAGSSENFTVTGLSAGTTYYFAMKTADAAGNWSYLSNVPSAQTASQSTVVLGTGWNLVSLPHAPVAALKAQDVLNNINANAGATIATQISRWNNASGIWQSRIDGFPPLLNNFDVVLGEGYFIKVSAPGNWSIVGTHLTSPVTLNLGTGWNLSAVPYSSTAYKAQDLINGIKAQGGSASQVSRWNNASGIWQSRIDGFPPLLNNFDIVSGEGYFIKTASSSTFTP